MYQALHDLLYNSRNNQWRMSKNAEGRALLKMRFYLHLNSVLKTYFFLHLKIPFQFPTRTDRVHSAQTARNPVHFQESVHFSKSAHLKGRSEPLLHRSELFSGTKVEKYFSNSAHFCFQQVPKKISGPLKGVHCTKCTPYSSATGNNSSTAHVGNAAFLIIASPPPPTHYSQEIHTYYTVQHASPQPHSTHTDTNTLEQLRH